MRIARLFDYRDASGDWRFDPGRPRIADRHERDRIAGFLRSGKMIVGIRGFDVDRLDPRRPGAVPMHTFTDGTWIWSAGVQYYLEVHGIAPEPDFLVHIARSHYVAAQPDQHARRAALALLREPGGAAEHGVSALEIVRSALAAFRAHPHAAAAELTSILRASGVPHAARAVALLPIAFGRCILEGLVALPATFHDGSREMPLVEEPIYTAAEQVARTEATSDDLENVGFRSAEVAVVNRALFAGSRPEDLVLAPPQLLVD